MKRMSGIPNVGGMAAALNCDELTGIKLLHEVMPAVEVDIQNPDEPIDRQAIIDLVFSYAGSEQGDQFGKLLNWWG